MTDQVHARTPLVTASFPGHLYTAEEIRRVFPARSIVAEPVNVHRKQVNTQLIKGQYADQITTAGVEVEAKFPALWNGDWGKAPRPGGSTGYPSSSEADLALASHIARACRRLNVDEVALPAVVESIFERSVQGQSPKWASRADYRERTIANAISGIGATVVGLSPSGLYLESHGDVRNARAFARIARGKFLYVATRDRWLRWDGQRWHLCQKDEHIAEAKRVCGEILAAAGLVLSQNQERGKKLVNDAVTSHNMSRIMAMLKLAASEPEMAVVERELDNDPYLLGVENGVVDLRTGNHLFNQPEMLITRYCNASYDDDAKCDRWLQFLDQIFQGDVDTIESVQRLLGCTLMGLSGEEILIICYGHGSNGKSVFSNVVYTIMGGYAVTAPPSLLTTRKANDSSPRNDIAAIAGARYLSINEMQAGDRLDEQVVKSLAGREPISARFLHQEFFEFMAIFTPWLRTNHKPVVTGQDDGIWRRLILLKFDRTFTDTEKDPALEQKLLAERDGILRWMVEGAQKYLQDGLQLSPRMKAEQATYRKESDLLGEFLSDKTVQNPVAKTNQGTLYEEYREWCEKEAGVKPMSKKSFTQRLAERGYAGGKTGGNRFYCGLALASVKGTLSQGAVDRVDRIDSDLGISLHENSIEQETLNNPTSCPTCPDQTDAPEVKNA